jgi:Ca2+/Na+ antiporter
MIAFSLVLLPLVFDRKVTRFEAALLLVAYIATMVIAFILSA